MKIINSFAAVCFIASIYSCNDDKKTPAEAPQTQKSESTKVETSKSSDIPFAGNWISKKYLEILHATKSPRKATTEHETIHLHIPAKENKEFTIGYNFHEGVPGYKVKKDGDTYVMYNEGDIRPIKIIDDNTIEIKGEKFHKMDNNSSINHNAVSDYFFKGNFTFNGQKVSFLKDNSITGLEDFKYYELNTDYIGPGLDIDLISLGTTKTNMKDYGFKFKNNSFEIYSIKCSDGSEYDENMPCEEITFGYLKYTLQHN